MPISGISPRSCICCVDVKSYIIYIICFMCFYISYDIVIYKSMRSLSLLGTLLRKVLLYILLSKVHHNFYMKTNLLFDWHPMANKSKVYYLYFMLCRRRLSPLKRPLRLWLGRLAQWIERQLPKLTVKGSTPLTISVSFTIRKLHSLFVISFVFTKVHIWMITMTTEMKVVSWQYIF